MIVYIIWIYSLSICNFVCTLKLSIMCVFTWNIPYILRGNNYSSYGNFYQLNHRWLNWSIHWKKFDNMGSKRCQIDLITFSEWKNISHLQPNVFCVIVFIVHKSERKAFIVNCMIPSEHNGISRAIFPL